MRKQPTLRQPLLNKADKFLETGWNHVTINTVEMKQIKKWRKMSLFEPRRSAESPSMSRDNICEKPDDKVSEASFKVKFLPCLWGKMLVKINENIGVYERTKLFPRVQRVAVT
jgi:hypothetical protein